jgi:hypothetical protein
VSARVVGIARHAASRTVMESLDTIAISVEGGLDGDCHGRHARRQVTVVTRAGDRQCVRTDEPATTIADLPGRRTTRSDRCVASATLRLTPAEGLRTKHAGVRLHVGPLGPG